jgi:hypothetical protein
MFVELRKRMFAFGSKTLSALRIVACWVGVNSAAPVKRFRTPAKAVRNAAMFGG